MQTGYMLLDTSVVSAARGKAAEETVARFLRSLPRGSIAVPTFTVFELERGVRKLQLVDGERARPLLDWLDDLLATDIFIPPVTVDIWRLLARMALVPALSKFWIDTGDPPKMRFGCDPGLAAIAIHYGMPIATRDVRDFMLIHRHFPLPGLYEPHACRWHIEPTTEWRNSFEAEASDDLQAVGYFS